VQPREIEIKSFEQRYEGYNRVFCIPVTV